MQLARAMGLTNEQLKRARQWLQQHMTGSCPVCRTEPARMEVQPGLFAAVGIEGTAVNAATGIPMVAVVCQHCAHVVFFGAQPIGVFRRG